MSRPTLSPVSRPYWEAFTYLERDRDEISHAQGMAGGFFVLAKIKRPEIRREGRRRGYRGAELEGFVDILTALDDERVSQENLQRARAFDAAIKRK